MSLFSTTIANKIRSRFVLCSRRERARTHSKTIGWRCLNQNLYGFRRNVTGEWSLKFSGSLAHLFHTWEYEHVFFSPQPNGYTWCWIDSKLFLSFFWRPFLRKRAPFLWNSSSFIETGPFFCSQNDRPLFLFKKLLFPCEFNKMSQFRSVRCLILNFWSAKRVKTKKKRDSMFYFRAGEITRNSSLTLTDINSHFKNIIWTERVLRCATF